MEDKKIDFYSFEEITSRMERTNVRLWIMCIILILALISTNLGWVYYENQFTDTEVTQDNDMRSKLMDMAREAKNENERLAIMDCVDKMR